MLRSTDRDAVLAELVDALVASNATPCGVRTQVLVGLIHREQMATTGIGAGMAIPHVRLPQLVVPSLAIGVSQVGTDFGSLDGKPVRALFLVVDTIFDEDGHLVLRENLFRLVQRKPFRTEIVKARRSSHAMRIILAHESTM